ncbi:MAG: amidohydrolase family protein [Acidobacteriia bacterium]|nr:amidohydrolase family protein [Terriglobia bacterium]
MMTRRDLLPSIPALMAVRSLKGADVVYQRFDTHTHIHNYFPDMIDALEKSNFKCLSICDSREIGDEKSTLPEMTEGTIAAVKQSRGRLAWGTTFDPRNFEDKDFTSRAIARVKEHFGQGAIAVKIWKNIGMAIRSQKGAYLLPDNPRLLPIYETIQREGKTLISHLADLNAAWMDPTGNPVGGKYYQDHPEWRMFGKAGAPSKEAILNARDRVMTKYPKLRVVGCHIGSNEQDLDLVARRLDTYPNFAVDLASRIRYLTPDSQRAKAREFLIKYQDRIIYGTDFNMVAGDKAPGLPGKHEQEWKILATNGAVPEKKGSTRGLDLPDSVLKKIFHDNAARWIQGIES